MTGRDGCAAMRQNLAVYVLGAIGPADRAVAGQHLASCPRCCQELAGLAGLPALLQKVPVAEAAVLCGEHTADSGPGAPAPEHQLNALLDRVARVRRHRRWQLAAAAAVLIAAVAATGGLEARQLAAPPAAPAAHRWQVTAEGFDPATRTGATVRYAARPWGTELEVHVTGIPAGTTCQFWVTTSRGQNLAAGGWAIAPGQQHTWYPASAPVSVSSLRGFEVTSAAKILVSVPAHQADAPARTRRAAPSLDAAAQYAIDRGPARAVRVSRRD